MRDIAVIILLLGSIVLALRTPWHGVLALALFGYLQPHKYAWGFATELPVYLMLFIAVVLSFFINEKGGSKLPRDWRIQVFYLLWAYMFITTLDAVVPNAAWPKFIEVSKIYLPLFLTLLLINTRQKLFYLIVTIAVSFGLVAVKGGIWAIKTGFAHRVYGPPESHFSGNNEIAVAILMTIPLIILWVREITDKRLKALLVATIPLSFAAVLSTHSRGALVAMGALLPLLLWHSKRKYLAAPALAIGVILAADVLPEHWFARMHTIETYEEDESAMGRIEAWRDGIAYAFANPLTGGGFNGWLWITQRDWHSAYVEALAEHGFVGFFLWMFLLYGTMLSLTRLPRLTHHIPEMRWVSNYSYMLRASLVAYAAGSIFLGITYWDLMFHIVFIAILVRKFALEELAQREGRVAATTGRRPWVEAAAVRSTG